MNAVAKKSQEIIEPAKSSSYESALALIERAAKDDNINVDKMRQLLDMRKEILAEEAEEQFNDAMTEAQKEVSPIAADLNNKQTNSKYASYLALDKALRPIYSKHGFSLNFNTADGAPENYVRVVCDVSRGRHTRRYHVDMPADGKGAKGGDVMTKTHAVGAAMTYGQRYLLKMIFNVAIGSDDDMGADGKAAISEKQAKELSDLIKLYDAVEEKILAHASKLAGVEIEKIEHIPVRVYEKVKQALNDWARKQREGK